MNINSLEYIVIASTILEFNPLFQAIKSLKTKSVKDVSVWTFVSLVALSSLWLYYGITISNLPIIIGNVIKLFTSFSVVIIYFIYKDYSNKN